MEIIQCDWMNRCIIGLREIRATMSLIYTLFLNSVIQTLNFNLFFRSGSL